MTLAEALRYQQELDAAQRPAYGNPNLAAQGRNANIAERSRAFPFMQAADAQFAKEKSSLSDPRATTDLINKGFFAGLGGAPVDLINMGLTPLGMGSAFPFGGSEHIKRAMEDYGVATPTERPIFEGITSLTPPRAVMGAARFAGQGAGAVGRAAAEIANAEMAGRAGLSGQGGAITYHGSPHRFPPTANNPLGEFDPMKIGTGEGAQAYGAGAGYLAEVKDLARGYQKRLSNIMTDGGYDSIPRTVTYGSANPRRVDLKATSASLTPAEIALTHAGITGSPFSAAQEIRQMIAANPPDIEKYKKALALLESGKLKASKIGTESGYLYKVDLPDEQIAKMLDWDKPLSQQPHINTDNVLDAWNKTYKQLKKIEFGSPEWDSPTRRQLETRLHILDKGTEGTGKDYYEALKAIEGFQKNASENLLQAGIPGIRYLDQGSRAAPSSAQFVKADVVGAADDLTALAKSMGLDAEVRHSGSNAGKSSYVSVFDPMTNRYIKSSFRISDHGTGPLRNQEHIHINSPADLAAQKNDLFEWVKRNRTEKGVDTTDLSAPSQGTSNFVVFDPKHMNIIGRE